MLPNLINRVALVVDASSSISQRGLTETLAKVLDNQIAYLAKRDRELGQETRATVYTFADKVQCLLYDRDVLRLPSLKEYYRPYGNTALIDGLMKAIEDMKKSANLYGDFAHLIVAITDGEENCSSHSSSDLSRTINSLPENWTVAVMVPNQNGVFEAKRAGIPANNINVWDTTVSGAETAGSVLRQATESFMKARTTGVKGTKNLFSMDTSALTTTAVKQNLVELSPSSYHLLNVHSKAVIKPFIESWKIEFRAGQAYYQLTKPEKVQGYKQVCIQDKLTGKIYGGNLARELLGLPDHEVKVGPAQHPKYNLFLQSSSFNRNLVAGTQLLVMK
jgi:hypothetical protein